MTAPTTLKFPQLLISIGDGNSPETFAAPCGLTARTFNLNDGVAEFPVIGQDWIDRAGGVLSCDLSGSGVLSVESFDVWNDWMTSREPRNVQIELDGVGIYQGEFLLRSMSLSSLIGQRVTIDAAMASSGTVEWTPAP